MDLQDPEARGADKPRQPPAVKKMQMVGYAGPPFLPQKTGLQPAPVGGDDHRRSAGDQKPIHPIQKTRRVGHMLDEVGEVDQGKRPLSEVPPPAGL